MEASFITCLVAGLQVQITLAPTDHWSNIDGDMIYNHEHCIRRVHCLFRQIRAQFGSHIPLALPKKTCSKPIVIVKTAYINKLLDPATSSLFRQNKSGAQLDTT
jgi:hypothetical protein